MIREHESLNIDDGPYPPQNEFRNRFPQRTPALVNPPPKKNVSFGNVISTLFNPGKADRSTKRTAYKALFKIVFVILVLGTSFFLFPYAKELSKFVKSYTRKVPVAPPHEPKREWHGTVTDLRPADVINHHYDDLSISIMVKGSNLMSDAKIHQSLGTFLRQMQHIQVCNDRLANTFIGGQHAKLIPFITTVPELPFLERYIDGFKTMSETSVDQEWFIQIDDDSYLFLENINVYLKKYKPSEPIFIHNYALLRDDATHLPNLDKSTHLPTGIMSKGALQKFVKGDYQKCILENKSNPSMGTILVKCLKEMGVKVVQESMLHISEPTHDFAWPKDPCARPLSFSQLSQKQMEYFYKAQKTTGTASTGSSYKWDTVVTYADIFHHSLDDKVTMGIDRHTYNPAYKVVESGMDCKQLCENDALCISWTFEQTKCYTSNEIGISVPRDGVVSGIVMNRYFCALPK